MSEAEQRYPDWRENPSAISEAVFYVATPDEGHVPGKHRFSKSPIEDGGGDRKGIYVKGDYVPDFDYAQFSATVFDQLHIALEKCVDPEGYESGTVLLRFTAFKRREEWSLSGPDSIIECLQNAHLPDIDTSPGEETSDEDEQLQDEETFDREEMLSELAALEQLHGDLTPDIVDAHSPRPSDEYEACFGTLSGAIDAYRKERC